MKSEDQPKIICLLGPTGSGKTEISLAVAKECNGVVINVDSRQVYADFPVITAQPGAREKAACPHRLYGFLPSTDKMSVGVYIERARRAIGETLAEGKLPLLVGGTGMYIRSLIDGIAEIPAVPKDISDYWAKRCQEEGAAGMHRLLAEKTRRMPPKSIPTTGRGWRGLLRFLMRQGIRYPGGMNGLLNANHIMLCVWGRVSLWMY